MRILTIGDSPRLTSGYGNIIREVNNGLMEAGHTVASLGFFQIGEDRPDAPPLGYHIYHVPQDDVYGTSIFDDVVWDFKPDVVFAVQDVYALDWVQTMLTRGKFAFCFYVPIDSGPIPSFWRSTLIDADKLISFTNYAKSEINKSVGIDTEVIYPGYDQTIFYRVSQTNEEIKKRNGFEDCFIFGYVGVNAKRKNCTRLIEAFSKVIKKHQTARLFMHTPVINEREGWNLNEAALQMGLQPNEIFFSTNAGPGGPPAEQVNLVYNLCDCMVSAASCEGFGLPILESSAVGTPNIGIDYSAVTELLEGRGELVKARTFDMHLPYCQQRPLIDVEQLGNKMVKMMQNPQLLQRYSDLCMKWAVQYTWNNQIPKFIKAITTSKIRKEHDSKKLTVVTF